ncbi:MAG TPA: hypothetical protein VL361_03220 [Candidatus Limnocylindrales bacterium]|jgi:hypothetical protein|nr:hypothetical protein [Candidatus Limnocylindrales bacterium]
MNFKIILAGLIGGVVMFLWGFISHMVLPLGEAGFKTMPHQDAVLPAISAQIKEDGLYIFPWPESPPGTPMPVNEESRKKAEQLFQTSPHGLLLFHQPPAAMLSGGQLGTELATNCASSLLAATLISMVLGCLGSFAKRVFFVTVIGLIAGVAVNVPDWNWYGFPSAYTLAQIAEHVVGFGVAGLVIAAIIKPGATTPKPAA